MSEGRGKPGYCKLCSSPYMDAINKLIAQGKNEGETKRTIQAIDPDFTWNRQTFYAHKDHITSPLVTHAEAARKNPVVVPKTTKGVLEAIRDIGMQRAVDHPEEVTVDHALRAATELNRTQKSGEGWQIVLAKLVSSSAGDYIEGEWTEVPALPTEEVQIGTDA